MDKATLEALTGASVVWDDPTLQSSVLYNKYPQLNPPLESYFTRKPFEKTEIATISTQLDLFNTDSLETGEYNCSLGTFTLHTEIDSFSKAVDKLLTTSTFIAIDIETTGLDCFTDSIRTIQLCGDGHHSEVVTVNTIGEPLYPVLVKLLKHGNLVFQNGLFDCGFLAVYLGTFPTAYCFDTMLAAQVCDAGFFEARDRAFGLGALCERYLGMKVDKSQQKTFSKDKSGKVLPLNQEQLRYAANDTIATYRLAVILAQELISKGVDVTYRELDHMCIAPAIDIKLYGVPVDNPYLDRLEDVLKPELDSLALALQEELKLPNLADVTSNTKVLAAFKEQYPDLQSTGESAIVSYFLNKEVTRPKPEHKAEVKSICKAAGMLLEFRKVHKTITTFIEGYRHKYANPTTKLLHPQLNICGSLSADDNDNGRDVATGRFCLAGNTPVYTVPSHFGVPRIKNIQDIVPGDTVITYDIDRNLCHRKVLNSWLTGVNESTLILEVKSKYGVHSITCTPGHKVRLYSGEYREAKSLQFGDSVLVTNHSGVISDGTVQTITTGPDVDVYDIEVEETRCFSADGIVVSNSSSGPNFMAFPADQKYRDIFKAPEGMCYIKVDASQQEIRILADVSGDPALKSIYLTETEKPADIYIEVASKILKKPASEITSKERSLFKCLSGNTIIQTLTGYKYLQDIKIGDYVLSKNKSFNKVIYKKGSLSKKCTVVTSRGILTGTSDHLIWDVATGTWKEMGTFTKGNIIDCLIAEYPTFQEATKSNVTWEDCVESNSIPLDLLNSSVETKIKVIAESINVIGYKTNDYWVRLDFRKDKEDLMSDYLQLMYSLGILATVMWREDAKAYLLSIEESSGRDLESLGITPYLDSPDRFKVNYGEQRFENSGTTGRIISVTHSEEKIKVYDIEVEGTHEFIANSVRVHNCIVLGVNYSAGPKKVAALAELPEKEAFVAINEYYKTFPGVKSFLASSERLARRDGFIHNKYSGRRRNWNATMLIENNLTFKYKTQSANHYIQSASADCAKKAFILAYDRLGKYGCKPMPPVHDNL